MSKAQHRPKTNTFQLSDFTPVHIGFYKIEGTGLTSGVSYWNGRNFVGLWHDIPCGSEVEYAPRGVYDHIIIDSALSWTGISKEAGK